MELHEHVGSEGQARRSLPSMHVVRRGARRAGAGGRDVVKPLTNAYGVAARITHIDRAIIRSYFQDGASLPPERRETRRQPALPRALSAETKQASLPLPLERKLSLLPKEFERVLVGRDVLLVESGTGAVIDILHQLGAPAA